MKRPHPYASAATLPTGEHVDLRELVSGARLEIEIGPGRGGFILERAAARPDVGIVGLEIRKKWAALVDARLAGRGLSPRARVFAEDARYALPRLGPDASVACIYLHFPDPWWKKRHNKRLVMGDALLVEIARLLVADGELFVQTDVSERAVQYEDAVNASKLFAAAGDEPGDSRLAENPYEARSHRERRAIGDKLPIDRRRWRRVIQTRIG